jgi:hypothetical protein
MAVSNNITINDLSITFMANPLFLLENSIENWLKNGLYLIGIEKGGEIIAQTVSAIKKYSLACAECLPKLPETPGCSFWLAATAK